MSEMMNSVEMMEENNAVEVMEEKEMENKEVDVVKEMRKRIVAKSYDMKPTKFYLTSMVSMFEKGKIFFGDYQRKFCYTDDDISELMFSIITGMPIPDVYAIRIGVGSVAKYNVVDGRQRLTSVMKFMNNEVAMKNDTPIIEIYDETTDEVKEFDIAGLTYEEFPEDLKKILATKFLSVKYTEDDSKETERKFFRNLNKSKKVDAKTTRLTAIENLDDILKFADNDLLNEMFNVSENDDDSKMRDKRDKKVNLVSKTYAMLSRPIDTLELKGEKLDAITSEIVIPSETMNLVSSVFEYANSVHDYAVEVHKATANKMYKDNNFASLVPFFKNAMENAIDAQIFAEFVLEFFTGCKEVKDEEGNVIIPKKNSISLTYDKLGSGNTASKAAITGRHEELKKVYDSFSWEEAENRIKERQRKAEEEATERARKAEEKEAEKARKLAEKEAKKVEAEQKKADAEIAKAEKKVEKAKSQREKFEERKAQRLAKEKEELEKIKTLEKEAKKAEKLLASHVDDDAEEVVEENPEVIEDIINEPVEETEAEEMTA